jgi:hypothetical protein
MFLKGEFSSGALFVWQRCEGGKQQRNFHVINQIYMKSGFFIISNLIGTESKIN